MADPIIILASTLLGGGAGFGVLTHGLSFHVSGKAPCAKCVALSVLGSIIVLATVIGAAIVLKG